MSRKQKFSYKKLSGQITLETAIIFPAIIMIIAMFIYISFYIHDVVAVKSTIYRTVAESSGKSDDLLAVDIQSEIMRAGLFVVRPTVSYSHRNEKYVIKISMNGKGNINKINRLIDMSSQEIVIEKRLQAETLYMGRVICDEIKKRKE